MALIPGPLVVATSKALHCENIPIILWGELAMKRYNIPTGIMRIDLLVPDDVLACADSALEAAGWAVATGPLPRALAGFWQTGWKEVAKECVRFHFPPSVSPDAGDIELLILPTSFVGLGPSPSLDSEEYTQVESLGPNVYLPSSHLMAKSIARTHILHCEKVTNFSLLLRAWASYFYIYCGFHAGSLDDAEQEVQNFWRSISMAQWHVEEARRE